MKTPIFDFVRAYADNDISRFHMPGHKGKTFLGVEQFDITEIPGADVLYHADGIIAESEANAGSLFGTERTFYSTEGSTLSIKAMLATALVCNPNKSRTLIAGRNAHKSLIYAAAELDFDIRWIYPEENEHFCSCTITSDKLSLALSSGELPFAVYITSPDYLGNLADVKALSNVCRKFGVPLLVDNAHGAYLAFLKESLHPIALGADMCADSAHKTLPVLTGGGYLHISKKAPPAFVDIVPSMLCAFASTSPSYLILSSLDLCNEALANGYTEKIIKAVDKIGELKHKLSKSGVEIVNSEPMKVVFAPNAIGYTGVEFAHHLRTFGIEVEFADSEYTVLMPTAENSDHDFLRITTAMSSLEKRTPIFNKTPILEPPVQKISVKKAVFSQSELVCISSAEGRICAAPTVACPPAVPVVVSGELITDSLVEALEHYGVKFVRVVK